MRITVSAERRRERRSEDRVFPVTTFYSFVVNSRMHGVVVNGIVRCSECNGKMTHAAEEEFPLREYPCVAMSTGLRRRNHD